MPMPEKIQIQGLASLTFAAVLRATSTILAGDLGFPYDQIVQVRVAISEMFDLLFPTPGEQPVEVQVVFDLYADRIEMTLSGTVTLPDEVTHSPDNVPGIQVLRGLVDELTVTPAEGGRTVVSVSKTKQQGSST